MKKTYGKPKRNLQIIHYPISTFQILSVCWEAQIYKTNPDLSSEFQTISKGQVSSSIWKSKRYANLGCPNLALALSLQTFFSFSYLSK